MADLVLGIFATRDTADDAIDDLKDAGYDPKDISIVMRDSEGAQQVETGDGSNITGGAASGAVTGGVIGGLAGLLIGIGAIAIPGVGAFLVGGPLAAALGLTGAAATTATGAATGALAGGLLGALMGLGIPENEARVYEERINKGAILVAVPAEPRDKGDAKAILTDNGAEQIKVVHTHDEAIARKEIHN